MPEDTDEWHDVDPSEANKGKYKVTEYGIHNPSQLVEGDRNLWFFFGFEFSPVSQADVEMADQDSGWNSFLSGETRYLEPENI